MTFSRTLAFVGSVAVASTAPASAVGTGAVISPLKIRMSNPTSFCDDAAQRVAIEDIVVAHVGALSSRFLMEECSVEGLEEDWGRRLSGNVVLQLTLSSLGALASPNFGTAVLNALAEAIHDVVPTATVKSIETPTHKATLAATTTPAASPSQFGFVPLTSQSNQAVVDQPQAPPSPFSGSADASRSMAAPARQATTASPITTSHNGESMVNSTERAADLARERLMFHMLNEVTPTVVLQRRTPATVGCTIFLMVSAVAFLVRRVVSRVTNEASSGDFLVVLKEDEDVVDSSDGFRVVFDDDDECIE